MITKVITDYLDDENVSLEKKYQFIKNLNLSYGDIFKLMEIYKWDYNIKNMLSPFIYYSDSKFNDKLKKQNTKYKRNRKNKNMRFMRSENSYD